ncbi:extensin family protein [Stakelama tenebrarum]|uniref:Extensin family protein n=1 Tax=Stakelama tenebrarum TaxID=2711215 RepID=A0A6G6Y0J8_9SPHN|nr:extensin family protein [Sphingosinithalassobacter tenebrarum]QIG78445.1 extensin family protein [Sphingosinithalassobacter tenebrarum]
MMTPRILAALLPLLLAGCLFGGGADRVSSNQPIRPRASGPITLPDRETPEARQCRAELARDHVRYTPLPDRDYGGGCLVTNAVQLLDIGVPVSGINSMRCPLAEKFAAWVRHGVSPAAREILGSPLVKVESMGTYACRGIVGAGASASRRLSEHALANAVDISAFVLADGRRITVLEGWDSSDPAVRQFMAIIHRSACRRFRTVLGPEYNAAHHNHFHLDMGEGPFCR